MDLAKILFKSINQIINKFIIGKKVTFLGMEGYFLNFNIIIYIHYFLKTRREILELCRINIKKIGLTT